MKLNLGCGSQVPHGWVNVDYALGARLARNPIFRVVNRKLRIFDLDWNGSIYLHNLTRAFPWPDSSTDIVYSSHTLEHFTREEGRRFLAECHRVLRKDGIIRIVVPDLRPVVDAYIGGTIRADEFVESLGVLYEGRKSALKTRLAAFVQFPHKCMYDTQRLIAILDEIGFDAAAREPFQSDIDDIELIELEERTEGAVIVEGRKR